MGTMAIAIAVAALAAIGQEGRLYPPEAPLPVEPEREHVARDHVEPEHRDLVAPDRQETDGDAGRESVRP